MLKVAMFSRISLIVCDYYLSEVQPGSVSSSPEEKTTNYYQPSLEDVVKQTD